MDKQRSIRGPKACLAAGILGIILASCAAPHAANEPQTRLEITIRADGTEISEQYTLECAGEQAADSSTLPNAAEACLLLEQEPSRITQTVDPDATCTAIYGGPQRAEVSGILHGDSVDLSFSRHNGCAIQHWDSAAFLLGNGSF